MHVTLRLALKTGISFHLDTKVAGVLTAWVHSEFWLILTKGMWVMQGVGCVRTKLVKVVRHSHI